MVEIEATGAVETFENGNGYSNGNHEEIAPPINGEPPKMEIPTATLKEIIVTDYIRSSLDIVATSEGFVNYTLNVDHGSSIGDGFIGIMAKVLIKEVDSEKQLTVLAKIPPQTEARRNIMNVMGLFEREVYVYNVVLPAMVELQKEKHIKESQGFFNFPKVYYANYNADLSDGIIIMEDLRESGHGMWSKYQPMNLEHAKFVMTALGRLHALSFALKSRNPEIFDKYKESGDFFVDQLTDPNMAGLINQAILGAAESLGEGNEKAKAKILKLNENLHATLKACVDLEATEPFAVINHGDCWTNNFMFHYPKKTKPDRIILIDWQISRYASPVIDLVYFFFICTDSALRLKHFDELLNIYHNSLKDLLTHLGGDVMKDFPFTALLRQLKKFGRFGVVMAAMIVPMLQMKNEDLIDMDFMAEQMKEAENNPGKMEEMMKEYAGKNKNQHVADARIRGVALDAIKYGFL